MSLRKELARWLTHGALCAAVTLSCTSVDIDPMELQPKFKPYRASPFFDDDRAMRTPPEGTIAREHLVAAPTIEEGREESRDGGAWVGEIPVPVTRELLATGRHRFEIVCAACHGLLGDGQSPVAQAMSLKSPPSLYDHIEKGPPGRLFGIITLGYGLMPSFADEIGVGERWAVVAYLRALLLSQRAHASSLAPSDRRELSRLEEHASTEGDDAP